MTEKRKVAIGITGASGAIYARALLEYLAQSGQFEVQVVLSDAGKRVIMEELGGEKPADWLRLSETEAQRLRWVPIADIGAAIASGSNPLDALAIVPCSMRTLAAVACGLADNALTRAADVCIKEGRRLVLVPREMPLSAIHLENMTKLARLGVRIVPPCPPFYHRPASIDDLIRPVVQKIVEQMGFEFANPIRWQPK